MVTIPNTPTNFKPAQALVQYVLLLKPPLDLETSTNRAPSYFKWKFAGNVGFVPNAAETSLKLLW